MRSEVDENLFGTPNRIKQAQSLREKKSGIHFWSVSQNMKEKLLLFFIFRFFFKASNADLRQSNDLSPDSGRKQHQYIKHITKDLIREILVPEQPGQKSVVIDKNTYGRLLKACNYKSKEELELEKQEANEERNRLMV